MVSSKLRLLVFIIVVMKCVDCVSGKGICACSRTLIEDENGVCVSGITSAEHDRQQEILRRGKCEELSMQLQTCQREKDKAKQNCMQRKPPQNPNENSTILYYTTADPTKSGYTDGKHLPEEYTSHNREILFGVVGFVVGIIVGISVVICFRLVRIYIRPKLYGNGSTQQTGQAQNGIHTSLVQEDNLNDVDEQRRITEGQEDEHLNLLSSINSNSCNHSEPDPHQPESNGALGQSAERLEHVLRSPTGDDCTVSQTTQDPSSHLELDPTKLSQAVKDNSFNQGEVEVFDIVHDKAVHGMKRTIRDDNSQDLDDHAISPETKVKELWRSQSVAG